MEIPLNAQVVCTDGVFGRSEYILINPVHDQVTHLVVKEEASPNMEYVVPVNEVTKTVADTIQLRCSKAELMKMNPFIKTSVIAEKVPDRNFGNMNGIYRIGSYYLPFVTAEITEYETIDKKQIPTGELAIHRGTHVEAMDGYVGNVDEFVINPKTDRITHLVMREGHLWGKKDVIIPLSAMDRTHEDTVFLKLDKHQIEALPTFPLERHWS
jgi:sporulation protein YlmC with PRC-barrel domain